MSLKNDMIGWLLALGGAVLGFKAVRLAGSREWISNPRGVYRGLLFIEPENSASTEPVVDELTRRMAAALNNGTPTGYRKGVHRCVCGAESTNCNYLISRGQVTNSLCVHYLAFHRDEVPESELRKVRKLSEQEAEPTLRQLRGHGRMKIGARVKPVTRLPRPIAYRYVLMKPRRKRNG